MIYTLLFRLHQEAIKTKKEKFAVNNLEKLLKATFRISAKIGFHEMSLRDLCRETGLSMGGIYSCISSKDILAVMVKDVVKFITKDIIEKAILNEDPERAFQNIVRNLVYTTEILQPWFYFLYFETRSLSPKDQEDSKRIEILIIDSLRELLIRIDDRKNNENHYHIIATMVLAMIQERYLKPWKYKKGKYSIEAYASKTIQLAYSALR